MLKKYNLLKQNKKSFKKKSSVYSHILYILPTFLFYLVKNLSPYMNLQY